MAVHKFFFGDRTRCAQLYPMARSKLAILRTVMRSSGQTSASQRFDPSPSETVFLYVNGTEEYIYIHAGGDGYYCLGDLGGAEDHISASPTAMGAFAPRGVYDGQSFTIPALVYVGRGKGAVPKQDGSVSAILETPQGITFKQVIEFDHATDTHGAFWWLVSSSFAALEDGNESGYGIVYKRYDENSDAWGIYLYTIDGAETWAIKQTGFGGGIEVGVPGIIRVGPRDLWGFVPAFLGPNNSDPQLSYLLVSNDNGENLTLASGGDFIGDIFHPVGLSDEQFNDELGAAVGNTFAVRLHNENRDLLIIVMSKIHADTTYTPRVYRAPISTGEPVFITELNAITGGFTTAVSMAVLVAQDTPLIVLTPDDAAQPKVLFVGDSDGGVWTQRPLPWPAYRTGVVTALDRTNIVCPVHNAENGDYELHQSEDLGQSWQFRATIRTDAPPPDEDTATLLRFGVLSILRKQDRPANSFPGQPWVGDSRISPPGE